MMTNSNIREKMKEKNPTYPIFCSRLSSHVQGKKIDPNLNKTVPVPTPTAPAQGSAPEAPVHELAGNSNNSVTMTTPAPTTGVVSMPPVQVLALAQAPGGSISQGVNLTSGSKPASRGKTSMVVEGNNSMKKINSNMTEGYNSMAMVSVHEDKAVKANGTSESTEGGPVAVPVGRVDASIKQGSTSGVNKIPKINTSTTAEGNNSTAMAIMADATVDRVQGSGFQVSGTKEGTSDKLELTADSNNSKSNNSNLLQIQIIPPQWCWCR
jgi:hypothetical protein